MNLALTLEALRILIYFFLDYKKGLAVLLIRAQN